MAAANEDRLLSRVVRTRDLTEVLQRGVDESWFIDPDTRAIFSFIKKHWENYGEVPTGSTVLDNFPTYRLLKVEDTVEYLLDQFVASRRSAAVYRMIKDAVDVLDDPAKYEDAVALITRRLAQLDQDTVDVSDIDLAEDPQDRWEYYEEVKRNPDGLLGIPTGYPTIDRATAGLQKGQLVTIVASPKTGKSVLSLKMAQHVHSLGLVPMYQSFEMSNSEQQQRFDALNAQISHNRLRRGILSDAEEKKYQSMLRRLGKMGPFYLTDSSSGSTVSGLAAKIAKYNPDVVFVDGIYLMQDEETGEHNTPLALTNLTRSLKRLAQRMEKPIVITTQALLWKMAGQKVSADSVGYSSSFLQDSDVLLGLERDDDAGNTRVLKIVESRNCGPASTVLLWDWDHGRFEEFSTDTDLFDNREDDEDDAAEYNYDEVLGA